MTTPDIPITNEQPVLIVWIEEGDELVHTDEHPFCGDPDCPCHEDNDLVGEYITQPLNSGTLTDAEAVRVYWGQPL